MVRDLRALTERQETKLNAFVFQDLVYRIALDSIGMHFLKSELTFQGSMASVKKTWLTPKCLSKKFKYALSAPGKITPSEMGNPIRSSHWRRVSTLLVCGWRSLRLALLRGGGFQGRCGSFPFHWAFPGATSHMCGRKDMCCGSYSWSTLAGRLHSFYPFFWLPSFLSFFLSLVLSVFLSPSFLSLKTLNLSFFFLFSFFCGPFAGR